MFGSMENNKNNKTDKNNVNSGKGSGKDSKNTKVKKWGFAFLALYNREAIEKKVREMAAKGWLIEEMQNSIVWTYRPIEPRELTFAAVYSSLTYENNAVSIEIQNERDELYAADGWVAAADWDTLRIYYNEHPEPVPIETEPIVQIESIYKALKKQWRYYILLAIAFSFQLTGHIYSGIAGSLAGNFSHFFALMSLDVCMIFFALAQLFSDIWWHKKALAAAEQGVLLPLNRSKVYFRICGTLLLLLVLSLFLFM